MKMRRHLATWLPVAALVLLIGAAGSGCAPEEQTIELESPVVPEGEYDIPGDEPERPAEEPLPLQPMR